MRIIDLSVALKAGIASDPPRMLPEITYRDHKEGAKEFAEIFPGLKPEQLPDGEGPAIERVIITTHNGTHLDAPYLPQHQGGGQGGPEDRRGAAGMVLQRRGEARLPQEAGRLCVHGRRREART